MKSQNSYKVMSISIFFLSINFLIALFAPPIVAQSNTDPFVTNQQPQIEDVEGLRAEFKQSTQNPESKEITFEMVLNSGIDSDRVRITWSIRGHSVFKDESKKNSVITVERGKSYSIPITLIPVGYGITELTGKAEAFKADSVYLVTIRKNFASNEYAEVLPFTQEYSTQKNIAIMKRVVLTLIALGILFFLARLGYKKFKTWLNK